MQAFDVLQARGLISLSQLFSFSFFRQFRLLFRVFYGTAPSRGRSFDLFRVRAARWSSTIFIVNLLQALNCLLKGLRGLWPILIRLISILLAQMVRSDPRAHTCAIID